MFLLLLTETLVEVIVRMISNLCPFHRTELLYINKIEKNKFI
jgi:hypothetical protein